MRTLLALALVTASASGVAARISATVMVDGSAIDATPVQLLTVSQTANAPAECTIALGLPRQGPPDVPFTVGQPLEVLAGTGGGAAAIFKGEVASIEPSFAVRGPSTTTVRAFDRLHSLTRGRRTKTYQKQTDADIVQRLAADAGVPAVVVDPGFTPEFVYQHDQTDLEFLRARAARIGFEVLADDGGLRFGPAPSLEGAAGRIVTLANPRLFGAGQVPASVEVRGWDAVRKEPIVGRADRGGAGVAFLEDHADAATEDPLLAENLVFSQAEADALARAALRARLLASQTIEGDTAGDPTLAPGMIVEVAGAGARFDGKYLVTGATHRFESRGGAYRTRLVLGRAGQ